MTLTLRAVAVSSVLFAGAFSAHADLAIPFQGTQSNSVQAFSKNILGAFALLAVKVEARGNGTAVDATGSAFSFPVTRIVIGNKFNIAAGSAVGSALFISRVDEGTPRGVTVANFTINYVTQQVLADTTAQDGETIAQMPLYKFNVATPLALKYRFPLTVTGHEVLNNLRLTSEAKAAMTTGLNLPEYAVPALDEDFGTLTQDVSTKVRKPAAPTTPYVPQ